MNTASTPTGSQLDVAPWNNSINSIIDFGDPAVLDSCNLSDILTTARYGNCQLSTHGVLEVTRQIIGVTGAVANLLIIVILGSFSSVTAKVTNVLIVNQSVIDMIASILLCVTYQVNGTLDGDSLTDQLLCRLWNSGLPLFSLFISSTYNIIALTVERYVAVNYPMRHKVRFSRRNTFILVAFTWIFPLIYQLLAIVPTSGIIDGCCMPYQLWGSLFNYRLVLWTVILPIEYIGPMVFISFCYRQMYVALRCKVIAKRSLIPLTVAADEPRRRDVTNATQFDNAMRNILKTMTIVVIMYAVCWTPFETLSMLHGLGILEMDYDHWIYVSTVQLMCAYSLINPLIYAIKYKDFRQAFRRMFRRLSTGDRTSSSS